MIAFTVRAKNKSKFNKYIAQYLIHNPGFDTDLL